MDEPHRVRLEMLSSQDELERVCVRNLLASSEERVFFKDLESRFLLVSAGFLAALGQGRSLAEVTGKTDFDIFSKPHAIEAFEDEQHIIRTGEPIVGKVERETFHDRPAVWVATTKLPLRDDHGRIIGTFGISRDVTAQIQAQDALAHQALHDSVTGLANRVALMDRLTQALVALERRPGRLALLFIDLDDFKSINDTLGHEVGDRVLAEVGRRLTRVARRTDTVSRFGGDEFVLLCTAMREDDDLRLTGDRIMHAVRVPLKNGHDMTVTCSLGAIATSDPMADPGELLQRADFAMYAAKRAGRNRLEIYDAALHGLVASTRGLAADLQRAIDRSELFVLYQPLFRLDDGSLTGVEALVRWRHPERGIQLPSEFIPLAEQHGLIGAIGAFVLDEACRQLAAWTSADASWEECTMAVNLSGRELRDPGLVERVLATLERHHITPSRLCLEITETALIGELGDAHQVITSLSALGVRIALDDFGTGYSTLAHLQQLRADILKIDRSFVAHIGRESRDREIIAAVTAMAHALGMTVVGEGIETDTERDELAALDCDEGQGYLIAAPLPPPEIASLWAATPHQPTRAIENRSCPDAKQAAA
jgi:diguanylate cyclase (GGDEF)-like protein/PAS domain S-box-containing protein